MNLPGIDMIMLARSLEDGLEMHPYAKAVPAEFRLTSKGLGTCGVASVAVADFLQTNGYDARPMLVNPGVEIDPDYSHVFVRVTTPEHTLIIDPTYCQLLAYAGLTSWQAQQKYRADIFPSERILVCDANRRAEVSQVLARFAMSKRKTLSIDESGVYAKLHPQIDNEDAMSEIFAAFWNIGNAQVFEPPHHVQQVAKKVTELLSERLICDTASQR